METGEGKQYTAPARLVVPGAPTDFVEPEQESIRFELHADADQSLILASQTVAGRIAPDLSCQSWINSKPIPLPSLQGKVVLLDFWATWCGPCVREIPNVQLAHQLFAKQGLVIIGVHPNSVSEEDVRRFIQSREVTFPVALDDASGSTVAAYRITAWPSKVLVGRNGKVLPNELSGNLLAALRSEVLYGVLGEQE